MVILSLFVILCQCDVDTGSISLENEVYLDNIQGHYHLTAEGVTYLNNTSFFFASAPNPPFSISTGFIVNSKGTMSINNDNNSANLLIDFLNTVPKNSSSGIFAIIDPEPVNAGTNTRTNRFMKIDVNNTDGTLIASDQFADSEINARALVPSIIFATLE